MTKGRSIVASDNVAQRAVDAANLERALKMRIRGAHWGEIASQCGFSSPASALAAVGAAMTAATRRAEMTADQLRDEASMQYDALLSETWSMLGEAAPYDAEGNQSDDRAVRLRAVDEARRIIDAKAKLNRLDAVKEAEADGGIRILGVAIEDII